MKPSRGDPFCIVMLMVNCLLDHRFNNMMGSIGNWDDVLAGIKQGDPGHVSSWELGVVEENGLSKYGPLSELVCPMACWSRQPFPTSISLESTLSVPKCRSF